MSRPTLLVHMDSGQNTGETGGFILDDTTYGKLDTAFLDIGEPQWDHDVTAYVRGLSTSRGTSTERDRVEAGTGSIRFDNRDGRFTPTNTLSPYYPDIRPMRRIRIQAVWNSVTYPVFSGFAEDWPVTFPDIKDQVVSVSLVDAFTVLARSVVTGSFPQQTSGERVSAVLEQIAWPFALRDIDTGASIVPAVTLADVSALDHLQQIEHAEGGRLFISRDGKVTFRDRYVTAVSDFSARTWTDDGTGMRYRDITLTFDDAAIYNDVRLTRPGGTEQAVTDYSSIFRFFRRSLVETDIQLATDAEVFDLASELLTRYREPSLRIEGLVDNAMRHGFWDRVLSREIQDQVLIEKTPAGSDTISQVSQIEGISHELGVDTWTVTFRVSPSVVAASWILEDSTYGLLDTSTFLVR